MAEAWNQPLPMAHAAEAWNQPQPMAHAAAVVGSFGGAGPAAGAGGRREADGQSACASRTVCQEACFPCFLKVCRPLIASDRH